MAVVMFWGNSGGTQGRCDARCHNARELDCSCMCGGVFHGAGRDGTLPEKVQEHSERLIAQLVADGLIDEQQARLL